MSKKIESNGFIANWSKIINSQSREDAEKDNKAKAKIIADDHRKYSNASVTKPVKVKDTIIDPAVKEGFAKDMDKLFDNLLDW
jgi:hypothetical protein